MRMTGVHRNMGANPRLFVFGYCLVVTVQFGVTSVTACPPETAADSPFTSYSFPPLSSVVEPYENDSVYGQINVYGVTTKSERHKRSYWTRTADGNGIGGRKAPVPYGS